MTPENEHHKEQHDQVTGFMGRMTEATEGIQKSLSKNWEQHEGMRQGIDDIRMKQSFTAGRWVGIGIAAGATLTIIGILLKGLSVLKYALGQ